MAALDFSKSKIEVRDGSTNYGPFTFDFQEALPTGTTISSISVKSYLTKLTPDDDLTAATDTTSELIDAALTAVSGSYGVVVYFNCPSTASYLDANHTIVFNLTLDNTAVHPYFFQWVRVQ